MFGFKQLSAILLRPVEVKESAEQSPLEAAGVPVSLADCRNCPNPCEEDHEEYPKRIEAMIDTTSEMLGSVKPYRRQVVISTGKSDWERSVTDVEDTLAAYLVALQTRLGGTHTPPSAFTPAGPSPVVGIFKDNETHKVSVLNGSHDTISDDCASETVLVFPDYKLVADVRRTLEGARDLWENAVHPAVPRLGALDPTSALRTWIIPYACVILICSHRRRDVRCAVVAPKLEAAFGKVLEREGWDVHTQIEEPDGPPLEAFNECDRDREVQMLRRLQELDRQDPKRALVLKTSHIGGHKYAGNVIIYLPSGAGVWYGRVSTHEVEPIVRTTIIGGRILPPLLRGGVNLARPDCKRLNDW
ncbi:Sucrase/ferredoxin-like-domain-containing protein [Vararia minispora EC-137]|uniref:Sucrase/ferredoxin-like-domain-containing protein n=1 Tax=Vararia minispora EC-137 TaxID=1314806 RepID=A0ACB8Q645_9AGAM|nr:Sucrase/ferredoxin-like-domain-containing protein [Vararia minispora EC-137]